MPTGGPWNLPSAQSRCDCKLREGPLHEVPAQSTEGPYKRHSLTHLGQRQQLWPLQHICIDDKQVLLEQQLLKCPDAQCWAMWICPGVLQCHNAFLPEGQQICMQAVSKLSAVGD